MELFERRIVLSSVSAISLAGFLSSPAMAQSETVGLQEIIVTAQKREQRLQDVPIAVTALSAEALQANRVSNVADLSGLAPGLTVMPTAGPTKVPQFSMRGATGNGVVPGSDRQISVYLDGVYLSGARGQVFDLPDVDRMEVLRGPQGTLFGRNATAGAISISTRDPKGEAGVNASFTAGNFDQRRFKVSVDLPQLGPFSAYFSFLHFERDGDIRNTAAGQLWDRRSAAVPRIAKILSSPRFLGSENSDSFFAAVKFESGDFTTVYKYDRLWSESTPTGTGLVGINPDGPVGALLTSLTQSQAFQVPVVPSGKRPDAVANGFAVVTPQRAEGHSLTSTYQVSDRLTVKNVFGYRTSFIFGASPLDGISAVLITNQSLPALSTVFGVPAAFLTGLVGTPFSVISTQSQGRTKQISDELQFNYDSDFLTATAGGLWFNAKDWSNEFFQPTSIAFSLLTGGVLPSGPVGRTFNEITSVAAYAQLELHVNDQFDVIAGGRITHDKKTSTLKTGPNRNTLTVIPADVKGTQFNYLIGVNYKPTEDILVYGKFSTAYLGGGSVVGIPYDTEKAKSFEAGVKSELFDRKLRANLALWYAKYKNVQQAQGSTTPGYRDYITAVTGDPTRFQVVSTFVIPSGNLTAKGVELDLTAAPAERLTFGGSLGYTDYKIADVPDLVLSAQFGRELRLIFRPKWTASMWAQYDTSPFGAGDAYLSFRGDARWQSDMLLAPSPSNPQYLTFAAGIREVPAYWVFNGRVALKDLDIGGINTELALWGRNLSNNRSANYALNLSIVAAANYIPARTYGVDLTIKF